MERNGKKYNPNNNEKKTTTPSEKLPLWLSLEHIIRSARKFTSAHGGFGMEIQREKNLYRRLEWGGA